MALSVNLCFRNILCHKITAFVPLRAFHFTHASYLYSQSALGIDNYLISRKKINERFTNYSEKFRTKMASFVKDDDNLIFTEDLKNMVHIAEPTDVNLVLDMIKKFNSSKEIRFGSFVFGPIVMRMFHFLDAPKQALQCFYEPTNAGFFDQQVSYQILLDLLYNNEMFEEIYKVFEVIKEKQLNMTKFPKYSIVLVLAACYKQNTPESFKYASDLWTEMNKVGSKPIRRASTFFAGLALKQGSPKIALEALSSQTPHYVTIRNIKAIALAQIGRLEDSLEVLRQVLNNDTPVNNYRHTFFEDTLSAVKAIIEKSGNNDLIKEFTNIESALRERSMVDEQNLDTHLNSEINLKPDTRQDNRSDRRFGERKMNFSHRNRTHPNQF